MVIFNFKGKEFEGHLNGKRLYPTESTKNLGVKIYTNLIWQYHVNDLSIELNRANFSFLKRENMLVIKH